MSDTSLSPRLRHLLIQEDRRTGRLIMPYNSAHRGRRVPSQSASLSPSSDPLVLPLPIPSRPSTSSASAENSFKMLPPALNLGRRASTSIFALLNDPNTSPSPRSADLDHHPSPSMSLSPLAHSERPLSAPLPLHSHHLEPFFHSVNANPRPSPNQNQVHPPPQPRPQLQPLAGNVQPTRPEMPRRHSSYPFESQTQYTPISGARAPISRTTKACNACRNRKVRCDAGGLGNGETSTCSRCREAGVGCVYTGVQKKRGPCPGSARPSTAVSSTSRSRRPSSHRSSFASTSTAYPTTPPDDAPWSSRSSYSFLPGTPHALPHLSEWAANPPRVMQPQMPEAKHVLSWPQMEPAVDERVFREDYTMTAPGPPPERREERTSLPPLKFAIGRRASYYEP
ncbi:hypothetical protein P7C73_g6234, partial [Tremellales sp. Uapishka_1]